MKITGIKLITVPVSDQDKAKDFFTGQLGFEVMRDNVMGPMRWLEVGLKGVYPTLALLPGLPGISPGGLKGVQLFTEDLDGDCAALRGSGVHVEGPKSRPWGRDATFTDPDGNLFVLMSAPPGE